METMRKFLTGAVLAVVLLAGVALPLGGGATPVFAAKTEICHWDTGKTNVPMHSAAFRAASWVVIEVNHSALAAHLGDVDHDAHTDGSDDDTEIGGFTEQDCLDRNGP
jgi:hypothetical protein